MSKKKYSLPFDKRGGVVVLQRRLLESESYGGLSLAARCLVPILQCQWRNDRPVDYGTREAAQKLGCCRKVSMEAFRELQSAGFIKLADESLFNSKTGSKARSWILTWLPYMDKSPTNDWEFNKSSGS